MRRIPPGPPFVPSPAFSGCLDANPFRHFFHQVGRSTPPRTPRRRSRSLSPNTATAPYGYPADGAHPAPNPPARPLSFSLPLSSTSPPSDSLSSLRPLCATTAPFRHLEPAVAAARAHLAVQDTARQLERSMQEAPPARPRPSIPALQSTVSLDGSVNVICLQAVWAPFPCSPGSGCQEQCSSATIKAGSLTGDGAGPRRTMGALLPTA